MDLKNEIGKIMKIYPVNVCEWGDEYLIEVCDDFELYHAPMGLDEQEVLNDIYNRLSEFKPQKMTHRVIVKC